MGDLISREVAIRIISGYNGVVDKSVAKRLLMQLPCAGEKRGIWIQTRTKFYPFQCSECKNYSDHHYDFCPHCYADMRTSVTALMEEERKIGNDNICCCSKYKAVDMNVIIHKLNTMDRYVSEELRLCDTGKKFPGNEVFIVDDVYEGLVD